MNPHAPSIRALGAGLAASLFLASSPRAFAQSSSATAEVLFQQGKELLEQGEVSAACPKFAESYRLDPALGTLMGLAICHEQEGKLASAWVEFMDAQAQARKEGRSDREALAQEKADALKPRLSSLTINVPETVAATSGLEILRDGEVLGSATWNVAIPVDGGEHLIEARAPGKVDFKQSIAVAAESANASLDIPPLVDTPPEPVAAAPVAAAPAPPPPVDQGRAPSSGFTTLQWVGIGSAGLGVVSLGVGGIFLSTLLDEQEASEADCDGDVCGDEGFAARTRARDAGNTASILGVAGVVLLGTGATLFFVGDDGGPEQAAGAAQLTVGGGPTGAFAQVTTQF